MFFNYFSSYFSGVLLILCGLIIGMAYCHLLYVIITGNAELLPVGKWMWFYSPFLWKHIDRYRNDLYNNLPLVLE